MSILSYLSMLRVTDVGIQSFSASRNSGGAVLRPHRESRGSEHHPREPHQVHHLSVGQAWAEPQGGSAAEIRSAGSESRRTPNLFSL